MVLDNLTINYAFNILYAIIVSLVAVKGRPNYSVHFIFH